LDERASARVAERVDGVRDAVAAAEVAEIVLLSLEQDEGLVLAIEVVAGDPTRRVDRRGDASRAPYAEVHHHAARVTEGMVASGRDLRGSDDHTRVVDPVRHGRGPAQGPEIGDRAGLRRGEAGQQDGDNAKRAADDLQHHRTTTAPI